MLWFPLLLVTNLLWVIVVFYAERKLSAFMQDRMGPTHVGRSGMLQAVADLLKLLQKESISITGSDKWMFVAAPLVIFAVAFVGYAFLPITPNVVAASGIYAAAFMLLGLISVDVMGILMAGWSSNNKYSVLGAMRSLAQIVSYEIPVGLSVLTVLLMCQTLDLQAIAYSQSAWAEDYALGHGMMHEPAYLLGIKALGIELSGHWGFLNWNIMKMPLLIIAFVVYYIATLAECNRAPFDLPEGESELVGGFHTEYSGFKWAVFFLSEYTMQLVFGALGAVLFLGAWNTPLPDIGAVTLGQWTSGAPGTWAGNLWGIFWLMVKTLLWAVSHVWVRWTFPRLRIDQLMYLCWQVLVPISLVMVVLAAVWRMFMI